MAHYVFRKGGIPALVSPLSDVAPFSCLCSLIVKVDVVCKQATIVLQFKIPLYGFDTDQQISLVYDADNLVPGEITLRHTVLCPLQLRQVARHDGTNLRSLGLALKRPCTVLCPRLSESIAPKHGSDHHFQQLVNLAKATRLHIVFDHAWLHPSKTAQFLSLTETSNLTGFSHNNTAIREADWTVFAPSESAPPEVLPSYTDASLKRSRQSRTGSPQFLTAKRLLLDPAIGTEPPSPTEKATTTASLSPRLSSSSPLVGPFDIQDAVESAVAKLLPAALQAVLPGMLTQMLAIPISSPSPQATPAPPTSMSPLHKLILAHLTTHADELAQQITVDLRDIADVELQEHLDDHRLELTILKEDGLAELNSLCDAKLQELKEHTAELVESVEEETTEAYNTITEKLDEYVGEQRMMLGKELSKLESERRPRLSSAGDQSQRASSLPLGFGG